MTASPGKMERSYAYSIIAATFDYPDAGFFELVSSGKVAKQLHDAFTAIYPQLENSVAWEKLSSAASCEEMEVEFSRLFDVGASGPPCPLNAGIYLDDRMQALEESVRFYNYFGLTAGEDFEELPDHITTQLEFMHFLAHTQGELDSEPEQAANYLRAQRDFLKRQLGRWIPQLHERATENHANPFYATLVGLLDQFLRLEQDAIQAGCGIIVSH